MHHKKMISGILGLAGFLAAPAWAAQPLTLTDCFQAAIKRSEILAQDVELVIQAEEHYQQALANVMPSVSAQGVYGRQDSFTASNPSEQHYARLTADQPLFRGFREYAALYQLRNLVTSQKQSNLWAQQQLYQDVTAAFYNVLAAEKDVVDLDTEIALFDRRIRDLQDRVAIGRSRPTEVLTVQAAEALLAAQRQQSQGQLDVAREILAFLTGLDQNIALVDPAAALPVPGALDTYLALIDQRPDILAAKELTEAARRNVDIASGAHWPSVDLSGDYYFDRSVPNNGNNWDAQIALTLPIFVGGAIVSKTHEAESQVRQADLALTQLRRSIDEAIRSQYRTLHSELEQLHLLDQAEQLAQKNYQAEVRDYNLGLITNQDVLQALVSYQDTLRSNDHLHFSIQSDYELLETLAAKRLTLIPEVKKP